MDSKTLEEKIIYHKNLYYKGVPEISDEEYDLLEEQLRKMIREELTEARYMRTHRDAIGKSAGNLVDGFFEHLLVLQQMRFENPAWAKK